MTKDEKLIELILDQNSKIQTRAAREQLATKQKHYPVKLTLALVFSSMVASVALFYYGMETQHLKARIDAMESAQEALFMPSDPPTPTRVRFEPYQVMDETPDCDGLIMTLGGRAFCST